MAQNPRRQLSLWFLGYDAVWFCLWLNAEDGGVICSSKTFVLPTRSYYVTTHKTIVDIRTIIYRTVQISRKQHVDVIRSLMHNIKIYVGRITLKSSL
jgi:hypothetical protein